MRQYEPIWIEIKKKHKVSLRADPSLHRRIIQAVRKEKATDLGWKLLLSEERKRYELKEEIIGSLITFRLVSMEYKPNPGLEDL